MKNYHYLMLYKSAKYILPTESFFKTDLFYSCVIDIIFALLHPNMALKG